VARATVGAALDGAVGREASLDRSRQVLLQEARAHPGVQVIPREDLAERPAPEVEGRIEALGGEGLAPDGELATIRPAVEAGPSARRAPDHAGKPAGAHREHALQPPPLAVVPSGLDPPTCALAA